MSDIAQLKSCPEYFVFLSHLIQNKKIVKSNKLNMSRFKVFQFGF